MLKPTLGSGVKPTPLRQDYYDPSIAFRSPPLDWMGAGDNKNSLL